MSKKADKVEAHRIHGELRRLVEVGLLGSEFAKEGEILKAALHIFSGAFGVYSQSITVNNNTETGTNAGANENSKC
jgi:hypothetical protein